MRLSALSVIADFGGIVCVAQAAANIDTVYVKLQPAVISYCGTTRTATYTQRDLPGCPDEKLRILVKTLRRVTGKCVPTAVTSCRTSGKSCSTDSTKV